MCDIHQYYTVWLCATDSIFLFFFLMIRRPPRSTLFPTRRSSDLVVAAQQGRRESRVVVLGMPGKLGAERSEEHTSELQSRLHLVCRLLLEKKKKYITSPHEPPTSLITLFMSLPLTQTLTIAHVLM